MIIMNDNNYFDDNNHTHCDNIGDIDDQNEDHSYDLK